MENQTVTTEDDFHRLIDKKPDDWHTRLVFADWLEDRGDPRSGGYRAIALQKRRPLQGRHRDTDTWWWHRSNSAKVEDFHNHIPQDWFALLPAGDGSESFWPPQRWNQEPARMRRRAGPGVLSASIRAPSGTHDSTSHLR